MTARRLSPWVAVVVVLLLPAPAFGHSAFLASQPEPGQRLEVSPGRVTMRFTEPLEDRLSRLELVPAEGGKPVPARVVAAGDKQLAVEPLGPLAKGPYRVRWHTVSTLDGHALEGSYSFGVRAAAVGGEHSVQQSPFARGGWLRVAFRGLLYVSLLLFAGALLLRVLLRDGPDRSWLLPPGIGNGLERRQQSDRRLVGDAGLVAAALGAIVAVLDAVDAADGWSASAVREFLLGSPAGQARVAVVVLVLAAGLLAFRGLRRVSAVLASLALAAIAVSGHANSASPRVASVANDWVHLMGAAVWLGGIALIVAVWWPSLRRGEQDSRRAVARHVLPAFGTVALPAFGIVVATGVVSAVIELDHPSALWQTSYGLTLAAKSMLVAAMVSVSYMHALRLRPRLLAANPHPEERLERRHWRLLRSEPWLGVAVLVAAALLASFPLPPRQLSEAGESEAAAPFCDPCPLPAPEPDQLAVAEQAGRNVVAAWVRRTGEERLEGEARLLDYRGKPARAPFAIPGASTRTCGPGCLRFRAPPGDALSITGRDFAATLPATWRTGEERRARTILDRAQLTMRALRSVRQTERVTSGPGSFARTDYRLRAPDRVAYRSSGGAERIEIGRRSWLRATDLPWRTEPSADALPFRVRSWFRWTPYAQAVRLLSSERGFAELALMDPGTPAWIRMRIDLGTERVRRTRTVTSGHFSTERFFGFNRPVTIEAPHVR